MQKLNKMIAGLYNGVTEQIAALKLDNQLHKQENMIGDITTGLSRRPGCRPLYDYNNSSINLTPPQDIPKHQYVYTQEVELQDSSGVTGKFTVLVDFQAGDLRVYKHEDTDALTLVPMHMVTDDLLAFTGSSYLSTANTKASDISVYTLGSRLIVSNRNTTVAMSTTPVDLHPPAPYAGIVYVKRPIAGAKYNVKLTHGTDDYVFEHVVPQISNGTVAGSVAPVGTTSEAKFTVNVNRDFYEGSRVYIDGTGHTGVDQKYHFIKRVECTPANIFYIDYAIGTPAVIMPVVNSGVEIRDDHPNPRSEDVASFIAAAMEPQSYTCTATTGTDIISINSGLNSRAFVVGSTVEISGCSTAAANGKHVITEVEGGVAPNWFKIGVTITATDTSVTVTTGIPSTIADVYHKGNVVTVTPVDTNANPAVVNYARFDEFSGSDSYGNQALSVYNGVVSKFNDLPPYDVADGSIVKVTSDAKDDTGTYYLRFDTQDGRWEETIEPSDATGAGDSAWLSASTMPLVFNVSAIGAGTATFTQETNPWGHRMVGDSESVPEPSFVGKGISDMFFYQNRLGFISGENFILSRTGDYFNFFAETATDVLDTDPIDIASGQNNGSSFISTHLIGANVFAMSSKGLFRLIHGDLGLTPTNCGIDFLKQVDTVASVKPQTFNDTIVYISKIGGEYGVYELVIQNNGGVASNQLNAHVPQYMTGLSNPIAIDDIRMTTFDNLDTLVFWSPVEKIFTVFKEFKTPDNQRVQNQWCKFSLRLNSSYCFKLNDTLGFMVDTVHGVGVGYFLLDVFQHGYVNEHLSPDKPIPVCLDGSIIFDASNSSIGEANGLLTVLSKHEDIITLAYTDDDHLPVVLETDIVNNTSYHTFIPDNGSITYNDYCIGVLYDSEAILRNILLKTPQNIGDVTADPAIRSITLSHFGDGEVEVTLADKFSTETLNVTLLEDYGDLYSNYFRNQIVDLPLQGNLRSAEFRLKCSSGLFHSFDTIVFKCEIDEIINTV